jgi:hypothetical protein
MPNWWGVASALLLVVSRRLGWYNFELEMSHRTPLMSSYTDYRLCFAMQVTAIVCAIIAARRGTKLWYMLLVPEGWFAFVCFLGEL